MSLCAEPKEPQLAMNNGMSVPQLAFGLYKVPATEEGERIILEAVQAGYRHFDTASFYGNEVTLGRALRKSGLSRQEFFIVSKVWNDAQKQGRAAVRASVEQSVASLDFGGYYDLFLVHWPVPGYFVETYKELELLQAEGKLKSLGLSNFSPQEYKELVAGKISVAPVVNQFEVSPVMYRPDLLKYFQDRDILVSASKSLHRGASFEKGPILDLSKKYSVTPAQIMIRWALQKQLIVVTKTSTPSRMHENRAVLDFSLTDDEMLLLDSLTTAEDVDKRAALEIERKTQL